MLTNGILGSLLSQTTGAIVLAVLAMLLGVGGIAAALRTRRRRDTHPEAYAAAGGILYTAVQIGCSAFLFIGGLALLIVLLVVHA